MQWLACVSVSGHRSVCVNDIRSFFQCADIERQTGRSQKQIEKQEIDNKREHIRNENTERMRTTTTTLTTTKKNTTTFRENRRRKRSEIKEKAKHSRAKRQKDS